MNIFIKLCHTIKNPSRHFHDEKNIYLAALPEEIAELALFLAGNSSNHITGQIIACDGGETLL